MILCTSDVHPEEYAPHLPAKTRMQIRGYTEISKQYGAWAAKLLLSPDTGGRRKKAWRQN
jgi:hypothetical protein